ncbi:MAG: DUF6314 family protein [Nocardioidaceae bacterium]
MLPVADLVAYLSGHWTIERSLLERTTGDRGTFRGTVEYEPADGGGLRQRERGELVWGGHRGPAYRCLWLRPLGGPGVLEVLFEDGRDFHVLDLRTGVATAEHACGRDVYAGEFEVESAAAWAYRWTVTGPHKSLLLSSRLTRPARA